MSRVLYNQRAKLKRLSGLGRLQAGMPAAKDFLNLQPHATICAHPYTSYILLDPLQSW